MLPALQVSYVIVVVAKATMLVIVRLLTTIKTRIRTRIRSHLVLRSTDLQIDPIQMTIEPRENSCAICVANLVISQQAAPSQESPRNINQIR